MISRRTFLDGIALGVAGTAIASTAKSYAQILGANDRLNIAVIGINGRGRGHITALKANSCARVSHLCDVDSDVLAKVGDHAKTQLGYAPKPVRDFRDLLASPHVDAISIAAPDHWHTAMTVLGMKAGKHVYVEKPCSQTPHECELLVLAQQKYPKIVVQVGDQQRSSPHTIKMVHQIHDGLIGDAYMAKSWYVNTRPSMGVGKATAVPARLDWDLFQGPAPRSEYKDNIVPYNWHWLRRYGTGDAGNNETHEVDICRWALNVDYPTQVASIGGRYQYKDDQEFPDTVVSNFQYPGKMISWEGRSCNDGRNYDRERGILVYGTKGSVLIDRVSYEVYDWKGKKTDEYRSGQEGSTTDIVSADTMTTAHFTNFVNGIRNGEKLNSPISAASISVALVLLSNIAWFVNRSLKTDPQNGHILNDTEAMKHWSREYDKNWEIRI